MSNAKLMHRIGCEDCNYEGIYIRDTYDTRTGEHIQYDVTCDCTLLKQDD